MPAGGIGGVDDRHDGRADRRGKSAQRDRPSKASASLAGGKARVDGGACARATTRIPAAKGRDWDWEARPHMCPDGPLLPCHGRPATTALLAGGSGTGTTGRGS
jgi:hypothetical protein